MDDVVEPVGESAASAPVSPHGHAEILPGGLGRPILGHVVAVRRENVRHNGSHRLDVSVGGGEYTEIVVRVESGPCHDLEGRRVAVHVTD